jgi:hypothetical protein
VALLIALGLFAAGIWFLALRSSGAAAEPEVGNAAAPIRHRTPAARAPVDSIAKADPAPAAGNPRTSSRSRTPARTAATPSRPTRTNRQTASQTVPQTTTAPPPAAPASAGTGTLNIVIQNTFADITIDGHPPVLSQKRVTSVTLPAGTYTVHFARQGYDPLTRTAQVAAGQEARLAVTLHQTGTP